MAEANNFIYGKRVGNKSIKVYKQPDESYLVLIKYYFAGFCYRKKRATYLRYGEVEDCIIKFNDHPANIR